MMDYVDRDCSFCNLFTAIRGMMQELKGSHKRKGHFQDCSFCNLFLAIQSMMQELKGDHMRKGHEEERDNASNVDMKTENLTSDNHDDYDTMIKDTTSEENIKGGDSFSNFDDSNVNINADSAKSVLNNGHTNEKFVDDKDSCIDLFGIKDNNKQSINTEESLYGNGKGKDIDIFNQDDAKIQNIDQIYDRPIQVKEENKSKKSLIWNHFEHKNDTQNGVECKHCEKVLKSPNGTTTTLWSHMKSKHPDVLQFSNEQKIRRKHSRRSLVWEHFNRLPNSFDRVKCNYCGAELSNPGGTTNMMSHLLRKHPNVKEVLITKHSEKYCSADIIAADEHSKDGIANSDGQTLSQGDVKTNNDDVKVNENSSFDALSVWDHFACKPDTNEKVECNYCGVIISNQSGNTSGMISHLTRKHPHLKELLSDVRRNKEQSMYDIDNGKDMDDFYHGDAGSQNIVNRSDSPIQMKEENRSKKSRIWNHFERKNDTENEVKCKFCEKVMKSKNGTTTTLWCHLKSKHPNLPELEFPSNFTKKRTCEYCKKIFSYQHSLLIHIQAVHLKLQDFTCEICGIAFSRDGSLKKHMYTHAEEMPFKCSHCDKKFKRKHEKNVHEKTHIGVFDYSCNYCPKYFLNKEWKISHERTHTGEKPFTCEECGNTFTQRSHLVTHVRIHTEEKPYDCQNCGSKFRHLSSYKDHRCTSPC